jgi:voltage-gated potassium channel
VVFQIFDRGPRRVRNRWRVQRLVAPTDLRLRLWHFGLFLAAVLVLHVLAMVAIEGMAPLDAVWLTMTTITTVGYGDHTAKTLPGRLATIALIYVGGIWVMFEAATTYFDYRESRRRRMAHGRWRWNLRDHILVLNIPTESPTAYLTRLVCELRASRRFGPLPVLIVSRRFKGELPDELHELGAVHYAGDANDPAALEAAGAREARIVIVLAREEADTASDGRTFDILDRLSELGTKARIVAECVDDANRPRLRRAGAHGVVRPLRGYPEMIVRALAAPGTEAIIEDLFTSSGEECWRYDVRVGGKRWADVVRLLVERDIGVPIGFRSSAGGQVRVNPPPDTQVEADKLFVIVREGNARPDAEVQALVTSLG